MKHFAIVVIVALLAIALLLFIYNPGILEDVWLWVVGLIGVIVSTIKSAFEWLTNLFKSTKAPTNQTKAGDSKSSDQNTVNSDPNLALVTAANDELRISIQEYKSKISSLEYQVTNLESRIQNAENKDEFVGTTLSVIRYVDDGETTLGLLFINGQYFCYTLEDTYREVKLKGKTRIPKGVYNVDFNRYDTELTLKYRKTRPWFHYHLHVEDVPGFEGVYIHSGSTHEHTAGCLLVASSIYSDNAKSSIFNSKITFEKLYKLLKPRLDAGERIRIKYYDEDFMSYSILNNRAS